jgi:F-type H+-transporting ATPase subunit epsilon
MALQLLVVTPERKVVETQADEVELPGAQGYVGILPGHAPLITLLSTGILTFRRGGSATAYAVSAGFAEVSGDRVSVLADSAQGAGEIDGPAAERDRAKAEEEMKTAGVDTLDPIRARLELAQARITVASAK